jgi:hypothetical protein
VRFARGTLCFSDRFDFLSFDAACLQPHLVEAFDVVLTSAVMEHIERDVVRTTLANLSRYLRKGGYMIHEIDLRDHINVYNPHNFLRYSEEEWEKLTKGSIFYTNRLRESDFLRYFSRDLEVVFLESTSKELPERLTVSAPFMSYEKEDLEKTTMFVILQKKK